MNKSQSRGCLQKATGRASKDKPEADVELFCIQDESQALASAYVSRYKACKPKACACSVGDRTGTEHISTFCSH